MHRRFAWMTSLFTLLGTLVGNFVFAQGGEPVLLKVMDGVIGNFKKDSLVTVEDAKWWNLTEQAKIDLTLPYSVRNIITFKLNEESTKRIDTNFTTTIKVKIIYTKKDASVDSIDHWFTINYNDTIGTTYNSQRILTFNNGYRVTTRIDSIRTTFPPGVTPWNVTPHLRLENEMQISRFYNFSCSAVPASFVYTTSTVATTGDLRYVWPDVPGATEYDVEWTFIDSTVMAEGLLYGTIASPDRAKIFEAGSSRMTVYTSPIFLPLVYDNSSYLFARVRAVQMRPGNQRIEGTWYPSSGAGYYFTGHETGLNWQSTTTFAEEAKRKTVISYADGSLKQRQTVTKDNSASKIIAAETLYDYQGRPAIQVLPAPNLGGVIKYVHDLNKSLSGGEYDKSLYDSLVNPAAYCSAASPAMDSSSGVNNYYSGSNAFKSAMNHKALPQASGYAFAETRYARDNTGRVMAQGGVGQQYQVGSKHETKYYYGRPDPQELAALFGTEAGDATHYQKNMVRDANGQYSVSYVDMKGRTIATALAGVPDTTHVKMDTLNSWNSRPITRKLLDPATAVIDGQSMQSTMGLVVTKSGNHVFRYTLAPDSIRLMACDSSNICYDCLYNLEISISDECNNQNLPGTQRFVLLDTNFTIGSIDTSCNAIIGFDTSFTLPLTEGSYNISKKLSVSRQGYEYYRDSIFMVKNFCKSFEDFYAEELSIFQQDCAAQTCEGCNAALGTLEEFSEEYAESNGIPTDQLSQYAEQIENAYQVAKSNCDQLCDSLTENDVIREMLLSDMMADGGQYANPADSAYTDNIFHKTGSVYNFKNISPLYYTDENGKRDSIRNSFGQLVPPADASITAAEFAAQFKSSWAEALLPNHPEYDKYLHYETLKASNVWDVRFASATTYAEAKANGYLNPIAQTGLPYISADSSKMDPIYGLNSTLYTSLRNELLSFQNINSINRSMWGLATATAHCNDGDNACFTTFLQNPNAFDSVSLCRGELDMAWRTFQQFYQTEKRQIISTWLQANWPASITSPPYLARFPDLTVLPALAGGPAGGSSVSTILSVGADSLRNMYQSNCEAYVDTWWRQIASCNFDAAAKAVIIPRLVQVCIKGSDANHFLGSSSISPDSAYAFNSFDAVIKHYLDSTGGTYNANCNGYLITAPAPFEQPFTYANQPLWTKPDSCQCEKITGLYEQYVAAPFSDSNFSGYVKRKLNVDMTEGTLQQLLDMCSGVSTCKFLEQPIIMPPQLQCGIKSNCVGCDSINAWHERFIDSLGVTPAYDDNDSLQSIHNRLYENYMNYHSGLNKSYTSYLLFRDSCQAIPSNSQCDTLKQILTDFRQYFYHTPSYYLAYNADGCDTITWRFAGSKARDSAWVKFRDMFNNGVVHTPDSVYNHVTSHIWSDSSLAKVFNLHYPRIICSVNNDFSWDVGVKYKLFAGSTGAEGVLLNMKLYDEDGNIYIIYVEMFQFSAGTIIINGVPHNSGNLQVDMKNWRHIKVKIINNFIQVYVDGEFRFEADLGFAVANAGHFTVIGNRVDMSVDYLRIFNGSGGVILSEEFDNACESFAIQNPIYDCDKGYCASAFTEFYNDARGTSLTESQIQALYVTHCGRTPQPCTAEDENIKLCSDGALFPEIKQQDQGPCSDSSQLAFALATERYNTYRDSLLAAFDSLYLGKCMKAYQHENFTVTANQSEFHYTLYYYDQAGNLVKTVPPAGVDTSKFGHISSWTDSVETAKNNGQLLTPNHGLPTDYRYNTLNQVKAQKSPDGGSSKFWYDRLGRLVLSQNAKQKPGEWYSYTVYDSIGRITQVGELSHVYGPAEITDSITRNVSAMNDLITLNTRRQITNTYYDEAYAGFSGLTDPLVAKNLRSRVSYTTYTEGSNPAMYDQATFYSYDIHGNVDTLVQDYRTGAMAESGLSQRFKKLVYQYDLISGKVNHVAYQPGKADQFYHRYMYDAENRITQAQTSADSIVWERDAMYTYYLHGPLLRTELGQYRVQGQDNAYTLQGWLKAINGVPEIHEIGYDGTNALVNQYVAKDAYSLMLHYNNNDYSSIVSTCYCVSNSVTLPATHSMKALYNGNIAAMSVAIQKLQYPLKTPASRLGNMYYNYKYDQLNRLTRMDAYTRQLISLNSLIYSSALNSYKERISYDANGNILTYQRNGADSSSVTGLPLGPLAMDTLKYKYYAKSNQLRQVTDNVSSGNYPDDIDNQSDTSNYVYDSIGNLIEDKKEGIDSIYWNVYGKITDISKSNGDSIHYTYDASGSRISKMVFLPTGGVGGAPDTTTTWYARDATGNVMSVYKIHRDTTYQDELHLYGSSRLGILKPERNLKLAAQYGQYDSSVSILGTAHGNVFRRGMKFFELSNHLGNVLVTISDKKNGYDAAGDGNVDYYNPVVMSANDYYPFGMVMPGRKFSAGNGYRYGFNGKENDNEVKGEGNQQDYGKRIYDPRLGRFLTVDPLMKAYPELTAYQFASNTPIQASDLDGAEADFSKGKARVMEYSNNPFTWFGTFWSNVTARSWNTVVQSTETSVNVFSEKGREKINQEAAQTQLKIFFYVGGTSNEEKLQDLKGLATNPHTYEELVSVYLISKGTSASFSNLFKTPGLGKLAQNRFKFARDYYESAGYSPERTAKHLEGTDFTKNVFETKAYKGDIVEQWRKVDPVTGETIPGDYYTLPGADPNKLGIDLTGKVKVTIRLDKTTKFLQSITADIEDTWTTPGKKVSVKGGETQLFQVDVKGTVIE